MIDLPRITDHFHSWMNNEIENARLRLPATYRMDLAREGNVLHVTANTDNYYSGFSPVTREETHEFLQSEAAKINSRSDKSELDKQRLIRKIKLPKIAFYGFSTRVPENVMRSRSSSEDFLNSISTAIEKEYQALSKDKKSEFKGIFDAHELYFGRLDYGSEELNGVFVRSVVKQIPLGERGGLSENLFFYARREFISPLISITSKQAI